MSDELARKFQRLLGHGDSIEQFWRLRSLAQTRGPLRYYYAHLYYRYLRRYGAEIPLSCDLSPTVVFPHGINGVFISSGAKIGNRCVIFHQVTIGSNTLKGSKNYGSPTIGSDVYIGAGAKVVGGFPLGRTLASARIA